jgi:hypothetical protein
MITSAIPDLEHMPGEMARRVRAHDWSATSLGPPSTWSNSLRTSIGICLASRVPIMIAWGRQAVAIYNDALAPLIGDKHPHALGRPYAETFPEIWNLQGPRFEGVMDRGESSFDEDQQICFWRHGMLEEMYYTMSWSPIRDDDGRVGGAFHPGVETTGHVVGARRLHALRDLAAETLGAPTLEKACLRSASRLALHREDMPFALLYLLSAVDQQARLAAVVGLGPDAASPHAVALDTPEDRWKLGRALRMGALVLSDIAEQIGYLPDSPWPEAPRQALVLPLTEREDHPPAGILVAGVSPRRPLDDDYRTWYDLVAQQLGRVLANAQAHEREHTVAVTLQESLLPEGLPEIAGVELATRYRPGSEDSRVGGDWYDALPIGDDTVVIVTGDVVGKGIHAAAAMGRLRSAVRAYAVLGLSPARIIGELNRLILQLGELEFATIVCGCYDRRAGTLTVARAGHPPPVLIAPEGVARPLEGGLTTPMGTEVEPVEAQADLAVGETVLLYTDGLIERRGRDLDVGLDEVLAVAAGHRGSLETLLDSLMTQVAGEEAEDDVAVLALRRVCG